MLKTKQKLPFKRALISVFYIVAIVINLIFRSQIPIRAAYLSPHDDQLGVELASNILHGDWLGVWNNRTFAKPPGYSMYLAIANFFPIPLTILNQIFYVLVVILLITRLRQMSLIHFRYQELSLFLFFLYLIFQPILFGTDASRVYRSSTVVITLTLLYSVTLLRIFDEILKFKDQPSVSWRKQKRIYLDIAVLTFVYVTMKLFRYESFWAMLCSLPLILLALLIIWKKVRDTKDARNGFIRFLVPIPIIVFISYAAPILTIQELNRSKYGVAQIENYYDGTFARTIKLWGSVEVGRDPRPYVVVSAQQRNAVYEISENALLMKPFLESLDNGWRGPACKILKMCDNSGGWFPWQLRDAATQTGRVYSEGTFRDFFKSLAEDIQKACDTLVFACAKKANIVGSKPFSEIPIQRVIDFTLRNFIVLVPRSLEISPPHFAPDTYGAPAEVVRLFHSVVRYDGAEEYSKSDLLRINKILDRLESIYLPLNLVVYTLAICGILLTFIRRKNLQVMLITIFLLGGLGSQLVGASLAQISFGYPPGPRVYLLSAYPLLQMLAIIGLVSFISEVSENSQHSYSPRKKLKRIE